MLEVPAYTISTYVVGLIGGLDAGGSITIHAFGAYYGMPYTSSHAFHANRDAPMSMAMPLVVAHCMLLCLHTTSTVCMQGWLPATGSASRHQGSNTPRMEHRACTRAAAASLITRNAMLSSSCAGTRVTSLPCSPPVRPICHLWAMC